MAKVGAAASVKKTTKTANTPVQAAPVQQPVPQAAPTGMAMTPQTVTAYAAPVSYSNPVPNQASYVSGKNLAQMGADKQWDKKYDEWAQWNDAYVEKLRAEGDVMSDGFRRDRFRNKIRPLMETNNFAYPRSYYEGKRAMAQPTVDQNFFDLWLLANGIRF